MRGPRFRTLAGQFTVLTAVPVTALVLAIAVLALYVNQKTRADAFLHSDADLASLIAGSIEPALKEGAANTGAAGRVAAALRTLTTAGELEIAIIDAGGLVLARAEGGRTGAGLISEVISSGRPIGELEGSNIRPAFGINQIISAYAPIGDTGLTVLTQRRWNPLIEALSGLGVLMLMPLLLAAAVPTFLIRLSAVRITRPIRELAESARRIAAGDLRPPSLRVGTGDEVELLAGQFDAMGRQLQSLYGTLEQRVTVRTAELAGVLALARAIGRTFDPQEIVAITLEQLRGHPRVAGAALWPSALLSEGLGIERSRSKWLESVELAEALNSAMSSTEAGTKAAQLQLPNSGLGTAFLLPISTRGGRAVLAVLAQNNIPRDDLLGYLEAVGAQVAVALDNAVLYRQAQAGAAVEERNRLAREIHDTLAQSLTGVIVQLEALLRAGSGEDSVSRIEQALEGARAGLTQARRSVQGLRASALDVGGLDQAIGAEVAGLEGGPGLRARFTASGDAALVPAAVAAELHGIAKEALTNIRRHAGAAHVLVNLRVTPDGARLVIEDDGAGFDAAAELNGGFGLIGMRERAVRLGGDFSLESEPGEGTRVQVYIPLPDAATAKDPAR